MGVDEVVIAFDRALDAIKAEVLLAEAALNPRVMPKPSAIEAGCGLCLRVQPESAPAARAALNRAGIADARWYLRRMHGTKSQYEPMEEEDI